MSARFHEKQQHLLKSVNIDTTSFVQPNISLQKYKVVQL